MPKSKTAAGKPARPDDWKEGFLAHLASTSNVSGAARSVKIQVSKAYAARRSDPEFAARWFAALCDGYDTLEMDLLRRLRTGELEKPAGKTAKRKFDNATAFRLLSAHRDTVSRERAKQQSVDEADVIASINAKLDIMRERMSKAREDDKNDDTVS